MSLIDAIPGDRSFVQADAQARSVKRLESAVMERDAFAHDCVPQRIEELIVFINQEVGHDGRKRQLRRQYPGRRQRRAARLSHFP